MFVISSSILPFGCSPRLQTVLGKHKIKPVFVFEDLVNTLTKPLVRRSLKSFAGIYMVVNLSDGKFYIGSAITGNLYSRFHKHLFSLVGSKVLASAVRKYGLAEFAFLVLETVPQNILLLSREDYYIETLKPEYNIAKLATNATGWKHTEESLQKMRENYSDERRKTIGGLNKGKTLSEETRALLRKGVLLQKLGNQ